MRYLLSGSWLTSWFAVVNRWNRKLRRKLQRLVLPRWLRKTSESIHFGVHKTEAHVARVGRIFSTRIANSSVGTGAKNVARRSRVLESRLVKFSTRVLSGLGNVLLPAPVRRVFAAIGEALWSVAGIFFVFAGRWLATRHYWHLVGGIPAFLLALPLAYCMIRLPFYGNVAKARHYRAAAQEALTDKDYDAADLYFRKLYQLGAMSDTVEYQAAINAFESGNKQQALEQMKNLAPESEAGFPAAHVWLARRYLNHETKLSHEQANQLAERHLHFALDREPGNAEARTLLALHFERVGRFDDALTELREVVRRLPEQGLTLAQLYARQGRWDAAQREVQKVLELYQRKEQQGTKIGSVEYEIWATACLIMNDTARAEQILERAIAEHPNEAPLKEQLRIVCVSRADSLKAQRIEEHEQMRLLIRACQLDPDDKESLIRLGERLQRSNAQGDATVPSLESLFPTGQAPQLLYAIMGTEAASQRDFMLAVKYLRTACAMNPQDAQSLNNLAWTLMKSDQGTDEEALSFADQAVQLRPDEPMYHETRGQILVRLGRYEEAVQELEYALNGMKESAETHQLLAEAYEKLGQPERAAAHRFAADSDSGQ